MSETKSYKEIAETLRKHIISVNDFPVEEVKVPEWELPFPLYIRTMSAQERDNFEARQLIENEEDGRTLSLDNLRASMLIEVLCADPEGRYKVFDSVKDVKKLGGKSAIALDRCISVSHKLNRTNDEDEKNLLKNSVGQGGTSG